jgi:ABC-2 type transport system ATP-binding protein
MDEPFTGLDPVNVSLLKEAFGEMRKRGTTLIFSTHQMEMVEELCEAVVLIDRGKLVLGGPILDVKRSSGRQVVRLGVEGDAGLPWLASSRASARPVGRGLHELDVRGRDPQDILSAALARGERVTQFLIADPSIEQIFIERVGRAPSEDHHLAEAGATPAPTFWVTR